MGVVERVTMNNFERKQTTTCASALIDVSSEGVDQSIVTKRTRRRTRKEKKGASNMKWDVRTITRGHVYDRFVSLTAPTKQPFDCILEEGVDDESIHDKSIMHDTHTHCQFITRREMKC